MHRLLILFWLVITPACAPGQCPHRCEWCGSPLTLLPAWPPFLFHCELRGPPEVSRWEKAVDSVPKEGSPASFDGKESACNAGDLVSISGSGRSPGERSGNPLQYSCLEDSMDRGAGWATVRGSAKSWTWLSNWHNSQSTLLIWPGDHAGISVRPMPWRWCFSSSKSAPVCLVVPRPTAESVSTLAQLEKSSFCYGKRCLLSERVVGPGWKEWTKARECMQMEVEGDSGRDQLQGEKWWADERGAFFCDS